MNQVAGIWILLLSSICTLVWSAPEFEVKTERPILDYRIGEPIHFAILLKDGGQILTDRPIAYELRIDGVPGKKTGTLRSADIPIALSATLDRPGFVQLQLKSGDTSWCGGAGANVRDITPATPGPEDIAAFWEKQKKRLELVPLHAELKALPEKSQGLKSYAIAIDCIGNPACGNLSLPIDAKPKSLPAIVYFREYGITRAQIPSDKNAISLEINAHGMREDESDAYYEEQKKRLKYYAWNEAENSRAETAYFNGMALRALRALEYIKTRPEWNGRDLTVSGFSQGGMQALWMAALDQDVTNCFAICPWCCDLTGSFELRRISGWLPKGTPGLAYYDPANLAPLIQCPVDLSTGLGDLLCPPSGIFAVYNQLPDIDKRIEVIQNRPHAKTFAPNLDATSYITLNNQTKFLPTALPPRK